MYPTAHRPFSLLHLTIQTIQVCLRGGLTLGFLLLFQGLTWGQFVYDWPEHSALSEGKWYRLATVKTGFHKVDVSILSELGLNPSEVNPANINLYGHGGDPLPLANSDARPLDLVPIPIEVMDDGDNQFDGGDHFIFYGDGTEDWSWDESGQRWKHSINPKVCNHHRRNTSNLCQDMSTTMENNICAWKGQHF